MKDPYTFDLNIGKRRRKIAVVSRDDAYTSNIVSAFGRGLEIAANKYLPVGGVALDVGANIGLTSFILSDRAARVEAFEPNPIVFELLSVNVKENNLSSSVTVHNLALSDQVGEMGFAGESAFGFLVDEKGGRRIKVETIDHIVTRLGLERVDFIKIDVEGFEPHVLRGARATIRRFRPTIFLEFNSWCLLAHSRTNPMEFSEALVRSFAEVLLVDPSAEGGARQVRGADDLVHTNITAHGSVDDVIVRNPTTGFEENFSQQSEWASTR